MPGLFWLTDPKRADNFEIVVPALPRGSGIIYRHFGASNRREIAQDLVKLCRKHGCIFLISDDPKLAKAVGATGVHWPFRSKRAAKYWRSAFILQTISAHSPGELRQLDRSLFDAAIVSTVFSSESPSAGKPLGAVKFRILARSAPLPSYGLGGISGSNAPKIGGFAGLAAVSSVQTLFQMPRI